VQHSKISARRSEMSQQHGGYRIATLAAGPPQTADITALTENAPPDHERFGAGSPGVPLARPSRPRSTSVYLDPARRGSALRSESGDIRDFSTLKLAGSDERQLATCPTSVAVTHYERHVRTTMSDERAKVVIIGAGFGGIEAAKALHRSPVEVTMVDRQNHHCFQPLLYQVATAATFSGRRSMADPLHSPQAKERDGADG